MKLSDNQKQLLEAISQKMKRGDVTQISKNTGYSKTMVSNVINQFRDEYNEKIVTEAVKVIQERDQNTKKLLQKVVAA